MTAERDALAEAIRRAINTNSAENASNTPDYILAQFMCACLAAFNTAVQQRETWYGRDARPSTAAPAQGPSGDYDLSMPVAGCIVPSITTDGTQLLTDGNGVFGSLPGHTEGHKMPGPPDPTAAPAPVAYLYEDDARILKDDGEATVYAMRQKFVRLPEPNCTPLYAAPNPDIRLCVHGIPVERPCVECVARTTTAAPAQGEPVCEHAALAGRLDKSVQDNAPTPGMMEGIRQIAADITAHRKAPAQGEPQDYDSLVARLRATRMDRDNFPRMDSERWLPVGLAREAADAIAALRDQVDEWDALHAADVDIIRHVEERARLFEADRDRLAAENDKLRTACGAGWGEPTLINTLRAENERQAREIAELRADKDAYHYERAERAEAERDALREIVKAADRMRTLMLNDRAECMAFDAARAKVQP